MHLQGAHVARPQPRLVQRQPHHLAPVGTASFNGSVLILIVIQILILILILILTAHSSPLPVLDTHSGLYPNRSVVPPCCLPPHTYIAESKRAAHLLLAGAVGGGEGAGAPVLVDGGAVYHGARAPPAAAAVFRHQAEAHGGGRLAARVPTPGFPGPVAMMPRMIFQMQPGCHPGCDAEAHRPSPDWQLTDD